MTAVRVLLAPAGSRFSAESGSETGWLYDLVTGIVASEPEFEFTCFAGGSDGQVPERVKVVAIGGWRGDELGGLVLPFRIDRAARAGVSSGQFDVVHHGLPFAAGWSFSVLGARAARHGVPLVVGPVQTPLEWTGPEERSGQLAALGGHDARARFAATARVALPLFSAVFGRLSARTLRCASRVVAISPAARELAIAAGVEPDRVEVIPPAVRLPPDGAPSWPRPGTALRILTAGYLIERKGTLEVVRAVAGLAAAGEPVVLDVAGDGPAMARIREAVSSLAAGKSVRLHGWLGRRGLAELYAAAHVYVSMSRAESWGHSVADALGAGLVVVTSDNVGTRAMAGMGAPLRVLPASDQEHLSDELRRLCRSDLPELQREGESGARWAAATLGVPVIAGRWAKIYREAVSCRPLPSPPS